MPAPSVIEQRLVFHVDDPGRALVRVGLDCDEAIAGPRRFRRTASGWRLALPRPSVARLEYRLLVTARDGTTRVTCDPGNDERVRTAFGERSVALMPGYERPDWLRQDVDPGRTVSIRHDGSSVGTIPMVVWSPRGLGPRRRAPLLVVNDGPEYADLASLTQYAAAMVSAGTLRPFRIALMQPVERDAWYAANLAYVSAAWTAVAKAAERFAVDAGLVLMGASLGGLCALLMAESADRLPVAGVFAQSGSFFQPRLDEQESTYPYFKQVTTAVRRLLTAPPTEHPLTIGMTCGELEENLANNQSMAQALRDRGDDVTLREVPDLHNYTAWRDALDPGLTEVLRAAWHLPG
jgi:enterochelin esterase-like enzyme